MMRKVRDPKIFERVVRALPNHAHWADGAAAGRQSSRWPATANTTREFVVDGNALRNRGGTRRRRVGLHQPVDRAGHHARADARHGHRARPLPSTSTTRAGSPASGSGEPRNGRRDGTPRRSTSTGSAPPRSMRCCRA